MHVIHDKKITVLLYICFSSAKLLIHVYLVLDMFVGPTLQKISVEYSAVS